MKGKKKFVFASLIITLLFILSSIIVSLSFVQVSEERDLSIPAPAAMPDSSFLDRIRHHARRLQLGKLRRSRNCHFYCQPAVQLHGDGMNSRENRPPSMTIMISHCLRCLRRKGFMESIREQRRIKRSMFATPTDEVTSPLPRKKTSFKKRRAPYHLFFGGWISGNLNNNGSSKYSQLTGFRRLLSPTMSVDSLSKELRDSPIIIDDRIDDDYINNYSEAKEEEQIPDFAKIEKTTQDIISKVLIGSFVLVAIFFIVVVPCISFLNMCTEDFQNNRAMCWNIICCRDPKYTLVKDMCEKHDIYIPNYSEYMDIMNQPEEKEANKSSNEDSELTSLS